MSDVNCYAEKKNGAVVLTSTPLPTLQVPHLQDPGENLPETEDNKLETPDFVVRLGTSLARSDAESQSKLLQIEFAVRPCKPKQEGKESSLPSIRSSALGSPIRRRSSIISGERQLKNLARGLGRIYRQRKISSRVLITSTTPSPNEEVVKKESALEKFRRIAKAVHIISGIWLWLKRYVQKPDTGQWSFMEMYIHVRDDLNQLLAFNPNTYGKYEPLREKLKQLLSIPKEFRSIQNIQVIMALMRDNSSFQDYPVHTQIRLARCMEYQIYEGRRVILKQGHPPAMFYIMLTGTALVNILDCNPRTEKQFVRTVHELNAGDTFGEIALIQGGSRTASIICKTVCEFLVVHKEDFDEIIKEPLRKQKEENILFCKSMELFRDFPCDVFSYYPSQFFYQYFKKDEVIVKNSRESKYIIVVKAGKCKLVGEFHENSSDSQFDVLHMFDPPIEEAFPLFTTMMKVKAMARCPRTDDKTSYKENFQIGLLTGTIDQHKLADDLTARGKTEDIESVIVKVQSHQRRHSADPGRKQQVDFKRASSSRPRLSKDIPNASYRCDSQRVSHAQISELQIGQVFGLESLISCPSTKLSLVSEGAECILISKRLFLSEANVKVLRIVTDLVQNYPSHDYVKDQVQVYRKWKRYKSDLEQEILFDIRNKNKVWIGGVPVWKSMDYVP